MPKQPATTARKAKVLRSELLFQGRVFALKRDRIEEPSGLVATREIVVHHGSSVVLPGTGFSPHGHGRAISFRAGNHTACFRNALQREECVAKRGTRCKARNDFPLYLCQQGVAAQGRPRTVSKLLSPPLRGGTLERRVANSLSWRGTSIFSNHSGSALPSWVLCRCKSRIQCDEIAQ